MADPLPEATALTGIYLYCLARPQCLASDQALVGPALAGVNERFPVTTVVADKVVAVVSEVVIADFSEQNLQTLSWIGEHAARHEEVVARTMTASPVLPVKFGTIYRSRDSLMAFLQRHRGAIEPGLDTLIDKSEWSVKGYLLEDNARQIIAAEDAQVQSCRAALSQSPGLRYLQQKQLDTRIETALEAGLERVNQDLMRSLELRSIDATPLRLHASTVTGRPERMVFNAAFLLDVETLPDFRVALGEQQDAYQTIGLALELRGPWPPYNFCPDLSEGQT